MCVSTAVDTVRGVVKGIGDFAGNLINGPNIPDPPAPPLPPQGARAPSTTPLRRRNASGGIAVPAGSTLLSGPSGVGNAQLSLGSQTLLGGG